MSTSTDQMLQDLIHQDLSRRADEKKVKLLDQQLNKRTALDPNFSYYDPDRYKVLDGDTVYDQDTDELVRFDAGDGRTADAFETDIARYDLNPSRANAHRKAYAMQFGRDEKDISNEDLVNAGKAQAETMQKRLEALRNQGMGFTRTGKDKYGRVLARFDNNEVIEPISGTSGNAGYFSDYNYAQVRETLKDIREGKEDPFYHPDRSLLRTAADTGVNTLVGVQKMVSGLTQGFLQPFVNAATAGEGSENFTKFFEYLNRGSEGTKELLASEGQKAREKFDQKESALLRPLFDIRKREYLKANPNAPEWHGSLAAFADETADRIEYLIEEPGRILDASFESLPYMVGVGIAGRITALNKTQKLRNEFLTKAKKDINLRRGADGKFVSTEAALEKYKASASFRETVRKAQRNTGITTVALTEGLSNASEVYNSVALMTEEEASQSEKYQALRSRGLTHEEATGKLATKAFTETFVATTILAGLASAVTGAAGFESRLFTRLGDRIPGKISADNLLLHYGQATGRAVGSFTGPGTREMLEESVQSGGGEFISQLAQFNATGLGEVGPGIGAATGEGAVVGFVSGAAAGGAGTVARGIFASGKGVANALKNTSGLDEKKLRSPITDNEGTPGGSVLKARVAVTAARDKGESVEKLLVEALEAVDGTNPDSPILINHIQQFASVVENDPNISNERKKELGQQVDAARDRVGQEATVQAREILKTIPVEKIEKSTKMKQIISMAKKYGSLEQKEIDKALGKFFSAQDVVKDALKEASSAAADSSTAESENSPQQGKTASQVFEEKMGAGMGPNGPGLEGHAIRIQETIEQEDEQGYIEADRDLGNFIASSANKLEAIREMYRRIVNKGEAVSKTVSEVNKQFGTTIRWIPHSKEALEFRGELTGTPGLAKTISNELQKMHAVREALAKQAVAWNEKSKPIKEQQSQVEQEGEQFNQPPIPGVSAEGGKTRNLPETEDAETAARKASEPSKAPKSGGDSEANAGPTQKIVGLLTKVESAVDDVRFAATDLLKKHWSNVLYASKIKQLKEALSKPIVTGKDIDKITKLLNDVRGALNTGINLASSESGNLMQEIEDNIAALALEIEKDIPDSAITEYVLAQNEINKSRNDDTLEELVEYRDGTVSFDGKNVEYFLSRKIIEDVLDDEASSPSDTETNAGKSNKKQNNRDAAIIRLAKSLGIKNSEKLISLMKKVTKAEKNTNERTVDPVTGQKFTALELMDQLESEGKPRMGEEFSDRRGYTYEEIADFNALANLMRETLKNTDITEVDLQFFEGVLNGELDIPAEFLKEDTSAKTTDETESTGAASRPGRSPGRVVEDDGAEAQGTSEASDAGREATESEDSAPVNVWAGSNENASLSNLAKRPFSFRGKEFFSVEHAYQTWKSGEFDQATYNKYTASTRGKIVGSKRARTANNWNIRLMEHLVKKSFEANPSAAKALLATGNAQITHTQDRGIWAKEFPRILMDVRASLEISTDTQSNDSAPEKQKLNPRQTKIKDFLEKRFKQFSSLIEFEGTSDRTTAEGILEYARYKPKEKKVVLYLDALEKASVPLMVWVVAHELYHAGLHHAFAEEKTELLKRAYQNETINKLARAIAARRKETFRPIIHVEEALVELATGLHLKKLGEVAKRYKINIPPIFGKELGKLIEDYLILARKILRSLPGKRSLTDDEVILVLTTMRDSVEALRSSERESEIEETAPLQEENTPEDEADALPFTILPPEGSQSPQEATEESTPDEDTPKKVLEGTALENARRNVYELERLRADGNVFTKPSQINLSSGPLTARVRALMEDGKTAIQAAEILLSQFEEKYENNVFDSPAPEPASAEAKVLVDTAEELSKGNKVKSTIMDGFQPAIDLLSDTAVRLLGPMVGDFTLVAEWTDERLEKVRNAVKEKLKTVGLPSNIRKALRLRAQETKNLLAAVPNAISLLSNVQTRRAFINRTGANAREEQGLNGVIDFVNSFIYALQSDDKGIMLGLLNDIEHKNTPFRRSKLGKKAAAITNRLHEYALQYLYDAETGKLDENLASIMAMEAAQWMTTAGASTLNNSDDVINELIGRPKGSYVSDIDRLVYGNGTLMSNVVSSIGQRILSQANLSFSGKDIDPIFLDELQTSLGTMALATLAEMNYIQIVPVSAQARVALQNENTPVNNDQNFNLVHLTTEGETGLSRYKESSDNERTRQAFNAARRILGKVFSAVPYIHGPVFEPPKAPIMKARGNTRIPATQRKSMEENSKHKWGPIKGAIALLDRFTDTDFETNFMESHDPSGVQVNLRDSVESKNMANSRSLQMLREWIAENGNKSFYFAQKMIRSGRFYNDSNTLDPKADKLHRAMLGIDEWGVTLSAAQNPRGENKIAEENFLIAIGLGLGINTSNRTRQQILDETREILQQEAIRDVIDLLKQDRQYTAEEATQIGSVIVKSSNSNDQDRSLLESGEKVHGLVALKAYADLELAKEDPKKKSITLHLPMEADGKNNGLASILLQIPPKDPVKLKLVKQLLRATGVYFTDDEFTDYPGFAQTEDNMDNYESVVMDTHSTVRSLRNGNIPPLQSPPPLQVAQILTPIQKNKRAIQLIHSAQFIKLTRALSKTPLIMVGYSAGFGSIRRGILDQAIVDFWKEMQTIETAEEAATFMVRFQKVIDGANNKNDRDYTKVRDIWLKRLEKKDVKKWALEWTMEPYLEEDFRNAHDAIYGHALQRALENKIGPILEIRQRLNEAVYLMNELFVTNFKAAVDRQERIYRRDLSARERKVVLNRMIKQGLVPLIRSPLSKDQLDSIEVTSEGTIIIGQRQGQEGRKGRAYFRRPIQLKTKGFVTNKEDKVVSIQPGPDESLIGSLTGYMPDTNIGVAAFVNNIHGSDGAVMSLIMGKHPILGVHDGIFSNFNEIDAIATDGSRNFYETHRDWSLAQEVLNSLNRMRPLLEEGDSRLSAKDKKEIAKEFFFYLQKYGSIDKETPVHEASNILQDWFGKFEQIVEDTNEARKTLFNDIDHVNHFAKEGATYAVPQKNTGAVNPNKAAMINSAETIEEVVAIIVREEEASVWENKKSEMIKQLTQLKETGGNIQAALNEWMAPKGRGHAPGAQDMLDVLFAVFQDDFINDTHLDNFRDLISLLRPMLSQSDPKTGQDRQIYIRLGSSVVMGEDSGRYSPNQGYIFINENAENPVEAILHEIIHAANTRQLEALQAAGSDTFKELLKEARGWVREQRKAKEGSPQSRRIAETIRNIRKDPNLNKEEIEVAEVTEYTAYLNATLNDNKDGSKSFFFNKRLMVFMNALARSLQDKSGNNVFYSSGEDTTVSGLDRAHPELLNGDTILELFDKIKALEKTPVDRTTQIFFDRILEQFIQPGLNSINEIVLRMLENPEGRRNLGKWINDPERSAIFLEATSQNFYNSPVEQSLQEVALHEILHPIFAQAIGYTYKDAEGREHIVSGNPSISKGVAKLIERVQTALTKNYGEGNEWQAFMPTGLSTDPALDEKLARQRYSHIFESGAAAPHEFMAIGLTNPQFRKILSEIDTLDKKASVKSNSVIETLMNLLERAIHYIKTEVLRQDVGKVSGAMEELAGRMVHWNAQLKASIEIGEDQGWVTRKLDSLNDLALRKMAKITHEKLQTWAENNSLAGDALNEAVKDKNKVAQLLIAAQAATASTLDERALRGFREAFESALTGIKKDHWLYQWLEEILPWADRNRSWIDAKRRSERLIDVMRQEKFEHTRSALKSYFDPKIKWTRTMKENITRVLLHTDIVALTEGENALNVGQLLSLLRSPQQIQLMIEALTLELDIETSTKQFNLFNTQSKGLANLMVTGRAGRSQALNTTAMMEQLKLVEDDIKLDETKVKDILDRLTSLRAFQLLSREAVDSTLDLMEAEIKRPVHMNGFNGVLDTASVFKQLSEEYLFKDKPLLMQKGYTADITDPRIEFKASDKSTETMKAQGFTFVKNLKRDDIDSGLPLSLFKRKNSIAQYSKSVVSLTGEHKKGTGMFDSEFITAPEEQSASFTAAQVHNKIRDMNILNKKFIERMYHGLPVPSEGVFTVPLYNEDGDIVDFRYIMDREMKREHLKNNESFDEVLPRMMASIEDKTNTKVINHEAIDLLNDEYIEARKGSDKEDFRFVEIGANVANPKGRELWNLLPKDTKLYARQKFGGDVIYLRDDVVNLVLGFRKIAWSNNKFLSPAAPVVDVAEQIWLDTIRWIRYRIAILTPEVVIFNIISNFILLLSQNIPVNYILRQSKVAIAGMRNYQKDLKAKNELELTVANLKREGKPVVKLEQRLLRLQQALLTNPVRDLVEEGMFTSIVEEFEASEKSIRKDITSKVIDKFGGITGVRGAIRGLEEAFMVQGSESGKAALIATQYGDFVGRFIQYNWQTKVKKVDKRQAIHDALDTFIYYNVPQNRILQFMNDNGLAMFTKFFFRIQRIIFRIFKRNPVQASLVLGLQGVAGSLTGSRAAEENITQYAFLNNLTRKFHMFPHDHIIEGELFIPSIWRWISWIPNTFFGR
jgi:predicted NAD-dependent protein-ADP-ribosyltransferase YbiA (DUF1768 family)